ncbi:MAG: hypothetical protein WC408_02225 [Candidatus Micrarchaeia archaeon]|jgi:hypothetical protein
MRTYESALDILIVAVDFIAGALTIPLRVLFSGLSGIPASGTSVMGSHWGSALPYTKADSWGTWFWVLLFALVLVFL